jgi:hypothetical protein
MILNVLFRDLLRLIKHWWLFCIYCCLIYISLPFAPGLWEKVIAHLGQTGRDLPYIIIKITAVMIIIRFLVLNKKHIFTGLALIIFTFYMFFLITQRLEFLAEKMHLIEYGILALVIYWSINKHQSRISIHFKILTIGFIAGSIDEIIQYFLPNRVGDIRDVLLNTASVVLGQLLIYSLTDLT